MIIELPLLKQGHMVKSWKLRIVRLNDDGLVSWHDFNRRTGKTGACLNSINIVGGSARNIGSEGLELRSKSGKVLNLRCGDAGAGAIADFAAAVRKYTIQSEVATTRRLISGSESESPLGQQRSHTVSSADGPSVLTVDIPPSSSTSGPASPSSGPSCSSPSSSPASPLMDDSVPTSPPRVGSPEGGRHDVSTPPAKGVRSRSPKRALSPRLVREPQMQSTSTLPKIYDNDENYSRLAASEGSSLSRKSTSSLSSLSAYGNSKVFVKVYIDKLIVRKINRGDQFMVKSLPIPVDSTGKDIIAIVATKLRVGEDNFTDCRAFYPDEAVWLQDENSLAKYQVGNGARIFIVHKDTEPEDASEEFRTSERVHISREGLLQKQGQLRKNWKQRFFVLSNDGTLRYFEDESSKNKEGAALGFVYCKGAEVSQKGAEIIVKSVTGRSIILMAADGMSAMDLEAWYHDLEFFAKQVPSTAVVNQLTAIEKEEANISLEVGPLVKIRAANKGIPLGYVMGRVDGHFTMYEVSAENANAPSFLFRRYRRTKYLATGEKAWETDGFQNVKYQKFLSRSLTGSKLKANASFGDYESIDIAESGQWKIHCGGMQSPETLWVSHKDAEKVLRWGGNEEGVTFTMDEVCEVDDSGSHCVRHWSRCTSITGVDVKLEDQTQDEWDALATFLIEQKLKSLKSIPHEIECREKNLTCPSLKGKIAFIRALKRFNSRKLPHLIEIEDEHGTKVKYIFKQDDDLSMDVAVMKLLNLSNEAWEMNDCPAKLNTYTVMATVQASGFCECIAGDTMLKFDAEGLDAALGNSVERWNNFFQSLVAVIVTTAAFDITDRHHNNVMFDPQVGNVALIDLSASLGLKAPMDSTLSINPVYFPDRFLKLRRYYIQRCSDGDFRKETVDALDLTDWYKFEFMCMQAYYAVYCDPNVRAFTDQYAYEMPNPLKFLKYLTDRKEEGKNRTKEAVRNQIVTKMEESDTITRMVATITSVLPMN